jgi:hypothetical protein
MIKADADKMSASAFIICSLEWLKELKHLFQQPDNDANHSDNKRNVDERAEVQDKEP